MLPVSQKRIKKPQELPKNQTLIVDYQQKTDINEPTNQNINCSVANENQRNTENFIQNIEDINEIKQSQECFVNNDTIKNSKKNESNSHEPGISFLNEEIRKDDNNLSQTFNQDHKETFSYEEKYNNKLIEDDIIPKTRFQSAPPSPRKEIGSNNKRLNKNKFFEDLKFEPLKPKNTEIDPHSQTLEQVLTGFSKTIIPKTFRKVQLQSINNLKENVNLNEDCELNKILKQSSFCGFIGLRAIILQNESFLYVISLFALLKDFFYQKILESFANFSQYRIQPPVSIDEILNVITDNESLSTQFEAKSPLLLDYFSISIHDSKLYSMPIIINGYQPTYSTMPLFLYQLITKVNWEEEEECLAGIIDILSSLFSVVPEDSANKEIEKRLQHEILTVIYPEIKKSEYKPSTKLSQFYQRITLPSVLSTEN